MSLHPDDKQKFNLAEILTIILVVVLLVIASYLAYKNYHETKTKIENKAQTTAISTKNWKPFMLSNDRLSFKYPPTWTITENQNINSTDFIEFKGADNFVFSLSDGQNVPVVRKNPIISSILGSEKITFLNQTAYLMLFGNSGYVTSADLVTSPSNPSSPPKDENAGTGSSKYILVNMYYPNNPISLQSAEAGTEYQNSVKLIESMQY